MGIPKEHFEEIFAQSQQRAEEAARLREQRRKELLERAISAETRIVAWIDLLGFSNELLLAESDSDYRALYQKLLFVHDQFDEPAASDEPAEQERVNREYGRSVLAISDGLVITASANAEALRATTLYDLLMSFIGDIIMAQSNCALNGIFLRGGISIGEFFHEDNFLMSPGLVRAYQLEAKLATYPVILIRKEHAEGLRKLPGFDHYDPSAEPSQAYFRPFTSPTAPEDDGLLYLNYLEYLADPTSHFFNSKEDHEAYCSDASLTGPERDELFQSSHRKRAARAMVRHREHLLKAHAEAENQSVKAKYEWLMDYQNQQLVNYHADYDPARIDVAQLPGNGANRS